jgi:hypothetical protein
MLTAGTIPMTPSEYAAVVTIAGAVSVTRELPGNQGRVLVELADGTVVAVDTDGTTSPLTGGDA